MIRCIRKLADADTVTPTAIVPVTNEPGSSWTAGLVDLQPGSFISRDLALRLIRCSDRDLLSELGWTKVHVVYRIFWPRLPTLARS
jgi:hypothetical protein